MQKSEEKERERRPSLKKDNEEDQSKKKNVVWDVQSLEQQELERKLNPVKKKITEPKTPYIPYEEGDDEYLKKLNEINKTQPTVNEDIIYLGRDS